MWVGHEHACSLSRREVVCDKQGRTFYAALVRLDPFIPISTAHTRAQCVNTTSGSASRSLMRSADARIEFLGLRYQRCSGTKLALKVYSEITRSNPL